MGKARLLIVEDDIDIGNMLKIYFGGMDFDVDVAVRGSEALEKTKHALPHLIVLDIMLPDIDGYEVCRALRTNMRTSHIPVIFLTQKDERSDKLQGLELGAHLVARRQPARRGAHQGRPVAALRAERG
ncbi:MAG TPA: response regulator, partial [Anaerolineales bacterium]|nr:response regulator [Anaerolineales bacterium]